MEEITEALLPWENFYKLSIFSKPFLNLLSLCLFVYFIDSVIVSYVLPRLWIRFTGNSSVKKLWVRGLFFPLWLLVGLGWFCVLFIHFLLRVSFVKYTFLFIYTLPMLFLFSPSDSLPVLYMPLPPPSLLLLLPCCFSSFVKQTSSVFSQPGRLPFEVPSVVLVWVCLAALRHCLQQGKMQCNCTPTVLLAWSLKLHHLKH